MTTNCGGDIIAHRNPDARGESGDSTTSIYAEGARLAYSLPQRFQKGLTANFEQVRDTQRCTRYWIPDWSV